MRGDQMMKGEVASEEEEAEEEVVEEGKGETSEAGIGITGTRMISQVMEEAGATGQITKMPRLKSRKKSESEENAEMICEL